MFPSVVVEQVGVYIIIIARTEDLMELIKKVFSSVLQKALWVHYGWNSINKG